MKKEFKGLLKSEIKKAEQYANKMSGYNDCKVTGYSVKERTESDLFPEFVWYKVVCEICRNYEERCDFDILLMIPMFDRRKTFANIALQK